MFPSPPAAAVAADELVPRGRAIIIMLLLLLRVVANWWEHLLNNHFRGPPAVPTMLSDSPRLRDRIIVLSEKCEVAKIVRQ